MADERRTRSPGGSSEEGRTGSGSMEEQARATKARSRGRKKQEDPMAGGSSRGENVQDDEQGTVSRGTQRAKEMAREKAHDVKDAALGQAREVGREVERRGDDWTTSFGHRTERVAYALRTASDRLRDDGENTIARMADRAAERVDRVAGYLEDENPSAMLEDLEDMGRNNPGVFLGVTFALGLVAGRFLKASSPERAMDTSEEGDMTATGTRARRGRYARTARPGSRQSAAGRGSTAGAEGGGAYASQVTGGVGSGIESDERERGMTGSGRGSSGVRTGGVETGRGTSGTGGGGTGRPGMSGAGTGTVTGGTGSTRGSSTGTTGSGGTTSGGSSGRGSPGGSPGSTSGGGGAGGTRSGGSATPGSTQGRRQGKDRGVDDER